MAGLYISLISYPGHAVMLQTWTDIYEQYRLSLQRGETPRNTVKTMCLSIYIFSRTQTIFLSQLLKASSL